MTDRAWFDAAKGDIPQWAASMPKDADGTTIDWDWEKESMADTPNIMAGISITGILDAATTPAT